MIYSLDLGYPATDWDQSSDIPDEVIWPDMIRYA